MISLEDDCSKCKPPKTSDPFERLLTWLQGENMNDNGQGQKQVVPGET